MILYVKNTQEESAQYTGRSARFVCCPYLPGVEGTATVAEVSKKSNIFVIFIKLPVVLSVYLH